MTPVGDLKPVDGRCLSDPGLDKWWLAGPPGSLLDTKARVFGRKKIYLVDKKFPKSENDLVLFSKLL